MKEFVKEDMAVAVEAAELTMSDYYLDIIDKHQKYYARRLGNIDPQSPQAVALYDQTIAEIEDAREAYDLLDQLVDFNLNRLLNGKEN